ncbi:MAG: hypothetical protein ACNS63_05125 [Candidatus Nitrospinota bacterium M3_3B_026]
MTETVGKSALEAELAELRRGAIDMNISFARMPPLLRRVRLLALNAEVTSHRIGDLGVSFGVVVKEVSSMAAELRELVGEAEEALWEMARLVALWMRSGQTLRLGQRAVDAVRLAAAEDDPEKGGAPAFEWKDTLEPGVLDDWKDRMETALGGEGAESVLWPLILGARAEIIRLLVELDTVAGRLSSMIERINLVAARKSDFLAVSAMIESARTGEAGADLAPVAESIKALSGDIAAVEREAFDKARSLRGLSRRIRRKALKTMTRGGRTGGEE